MFPAISCLLLPLLPRGIAAVASAPSSSSSAASRALSFGAHVGAAVAAAAEIREDVAGESKSAVGHGHGMLSLVGSRLCRELYVLRESIAEEMEDNLERRGLSKRLWQVPLHTVLRVLTSTVFTATLAIAGLWAALLEVMEDSRPGGHHGAVFLAVNELLELLQASRVARGRFLRVIENQVLRLFLVSGASLFATMETVRSFDKVGAHHGVLVLAVSKTLRTIGLLQGRLKETKETEKEE
jgi:hypothetical protein